MNRSQLENQSARSRGLAAIGLVFSFVSLCTACNGPSPSAKWLANGFFDPAQTGNFDTPIRIEIRDEVSILDEPYGIQDAEEPTEEDLEVRMVNPAIGPGDFVKVTIFELLAPNLMHEQQLQVGGSGVESIPVIGAVQFAGFTAQELEQHLRDILREKEILANAEVQVTVLRYESQQFSIMGGVVQPGNYPLTRPDFRLTSALSQAGGLPPTADTIIVIRRSGPRVLSSMGRQSPDSQPATSEPDGELVQFTMSDVSPTGSGGAPATTKPSGVNELEILEGGPTKSSGDLAPVLDPETGEWKLVPAATGPSNGTTGLMRPETASAPAEWTGSEDDLESAVRVLEIPAKALKQGEDRYNIVIRPGDVIDVPIGEVGEFYVYGNIQRPGAFQLTGRRVTVKQAIASAGGFSPLAWPSRADLIRRVNKDEEQFIQIDLDAIFAGRAPDFYLRPNDMINVGSSPVAVFLAVARNAFRFSYGFGFVYDRNFADSDSFGAKEQVKLRRNQERLQRGLPF